MKLEQIQAPSDIKGMDNQQLTELAQEIREELISSVSKTGGHLSSNLGIVELTLALYSVFNAPEDKILWDVGHQTYVQKLLTGRKDRFAVLRKKGGISGFTRSYESEYDLFNSGHASNSISLAYGMAKARDLQHEKGEVIAVIGDGALTGGMAYEALNQAGKGESKIIVIVNDNEMSIGHNVGHMTQNLSRIRTRKTYVRTKLDIKRMILQIPGIGNWMFRHLDRLKQRFKYFLLDGVFFEEMGFIYMGPVDGHNIKDLRKILQQAKRLDESVIVHVRTTKGKGYLPAEQDPSYFHGVGPFDPVTGKGLTSQKMPTWSDVFGQAMVDLAKKDPKLVAISAAMTDGTGLAPFASLYPDRMFDVGIAEGHAVTFACGLAEAGMHPVAAIYSTFLQRAYDSVLHDVCMNQLPVILAIDRAGIVGEDGESHQGIYDLAYLSHIPGLTVMAPADAEELKEMVAAGLAWQIPAAIRYPRGEATVRNRAMVPIEKGRAEIVKEGSKVAVLALGCCVSMAEEAAENLAAKGYQPTVINARFASPVDEECILQTASSHDWILTVEDHIATGGFGEKVAALLSSQKRCRVEKIAIPDQFVQQGTRGELLKEYGIDAQGIEEKALRLYQKGPQDE